MSITSSEMSHSTDRLHPVAWMVWCAAAALITLVARSPWILLGMALINLALLCRLQGPAFHLRRLTWLVPVILLPALLNVVFSRAGTTVLLDLNRGWLGGPFTLEALVFGLLAGVQLAVTLLVFQVFSLTITPQDLLRRTPPAFYPLGVMASIAVTFTASVRRRFDALREAQQLRGRQVHGWRALPIVLMPLLVVSLEDAMATAEGLAALGWISGEPSVNGVSASRYPYRLSGAVGWLLLGAAILVLLAPSGGQWTALALAGAGLVLVGITNRADGRGRYRPDRWRWQDISLVAGSLAALALVLYQITFNPSLMVYQPYPSLSLPAWSPSQAVVLLFMTLPIWLVGRD